MPSKYLQMSSFPSVPEFYAGRGIFITGATGFLGKALVEKLLRACPDCALYLMIRPKKGKEIQERLEEIFESKVTFFITVLILIYKLIPG